MAIIVRSLTPPPRLFMHDVPATLAWQWPSLSVTLTTLGIALVVWCGFWLYVWQHYLPIVINTIGKAPLLVPEPSVPLPGGEECSFPTTDGLTLRGSYLSHRGSERRGVILFGHELNGDRWNAGPYTSELLDAGYDVFTFDFRNHGTSDVQPGAVMRPWINPESVADVRAAVAYLAARPDADPRGIGVLGISRGGGAALCAAAVEPTIRCIFTDGAYPSRTTHFLYLQRYVEIYVPRGWHWLSRNLPQWVYEIFLTQGRKVWGKENHYAFVDVEQTAARVQQPVLMVHGERDPMIPVDAARALQQAIAGPSKLWVCPKAKHNGAVNAAPEEYRRRLLRFFRLHLAPHSRSRTGAKPIAAGRS